MIASVSLPFGLRLSSMIFQLLHSKATVSSGPIQMILLLQHHGQTFEMTFSRTQFLMSQISVACGKRRVKLYSSTRRWTMTSLTLSMTMLPNLGLQFGKIQLTLPFNLLRSHRNFVQSQSIPSSLPLVPFSQSRRQYRQRWSRSGHLILMLTMMRLTIQLMFAHWWPQVRRDVHPFPFLQLLINLQWFDKKLILSRMTPWTPLPRQKKTLFGATAWFFRCIILQRQEWSTVCIDMFFYAMWLGLRSLPSQIFRVSIKWGHCHLIYPTFVCVFGTASRWFILDLGFGIHPCRCRVPSSSSELGHREGEMSYFCSPSADTTSTTSCSWCVSVFPICTRYIFGLAEWQFGSTGWLPISTTLSWWFCAYCIATTVDSSPQCADTLHCSTTTDGNPWRWPGSFLLEFWRWWSLGLYAHTTIYDHCRWSRHFIYVIFINEFPDSTPISIDNFNTTSTTSSWGWVVWEMSSWL